MTTYYNLISVSQLADLIAVGDCRVVDCRFDLMQPDKGRLDYLAGHIPGAVFADLDKDLADPVTASSGRHPLPDVARFSAALQSWGINNDTQVVAYDGAGGALAARFWWLLRWMGNDRVALLDGGLAAWMKANGELESTEPNVSRAVFTAAPDFSRVATTGEIFAAVDDGARFNLVDARDTGRFLGKSEPIDTVAGHIPGAINLPLTRNLDTDGRWRPARDVKRLWEDALAEWPELPVTVMCGSGVTACHLVLATQIAGLAEPKLYVGSWSEWIRNPSRPIATEVQQ